MLKLQEMERKGTAAVMRLRREKLEKGLPFMINSNEIPSNQCYLEYPNGAIKLVRLAESKMDFDIISELSPLENKSLRARLKLPA